MPPSPMTPKRRTATYFGLAAFLLIVFWALWHGVVGPRVIDPIPGDPEAVAPAPDPERAPPTE